MSELEHSLFDIHLLSSASVSRAARDIIQWSISSPLTSLSLVTAFLSLVLTYFSPNKHGKPLPGPMGIPWVGPIWAIEDKIYKRFTVWSEKFGSIYQVNIFGAKFIILSDAQMARDILTINARISSDRPPVAVIDDSKTSGRYLPFLGNNETLKLQRKFAVTVAAYTHQAKYHDRVLPETIRFMHKLLTKHDDPFTLLEKCCGRISSRMAFGTPAPHSGMTRSAHHLMKNLSPGGRITNVMTFLRHLPTFLNPETHDEITRMEIEDRVWNSNVAKAKAAYKAGTLKPCYAKYYFDNAEDTGLTEQQAVYGIAMLATVSVITISTPVQRWIVLMAEHPEWQEAVQKELREQMDGRMVESTDSPKLPVLRATILESMRLASSIPTGILHRLEEDMEYGGYHLPKDSTVLACDWAISHSPTTYPSPTTFSPSRYLDPSSVSYKTPLSIYPRIQGHSMFGYGRRICIGQDYAASQILTLCAGISMFFDFELGVDAEGRKLTAQDCLDGATPHVIPVMTDVDVRFRVRDGEARRRLQEMYRGLEENDTEPWGEECM